MCNDEQEASYRKGEQGNCHISAVTVHVHENLSVFFSAVKTFSYCYSDKRQPEFSLKLFLCKHKCNVKTEMVQNFFGLAAFHSLKE